jgi:hypothetical protein
VYLLFRTPHIVRGAQKGPMPIQGPAIKLHIDCGTLYMMNPATNTIGRSPPVDEISQHSLIMLLHSRHPHSGKTWSCGSDATHNTVQRHTHTFHGRASLSIGWRDVKARFPRPMPLATLLHTHTHAEPSQHNPLPQAHLGNCTTTPQSIAPISQGFRSNEQGPRPINNDDEVLPSPPPR